MDKARFIEVDAGVRYWEDAYLNGKEDTEGAVPLRNGDRWQPKIELATGTVVGWTDGIAADIHYKVCDDGEYWLLDTDGKRIAKWRGDYVPNKILCVGDNGYGDYIIMKINHDSLIDGWEPPVINADEWEQI